MTTQQEEAEQISKDVFNSFTGLFDMQEKITKALLSFGQSEFERGVREAADIADKRIDPGWPSDDLSEQATTTRNLILKLLPSPERKP